jgi:hypothetical protein
MLICWFRRNLSDVGSDTRVAEGRLIQTIVLPHEGGDEIKSIFHWRAAHRLRRSRHKRRAARKFDSGALYDGFPPDESLDDDCRCRKKRRPRKPQGRAVKVEARITAVEIAVRIAHG